MVFLKEKKEVDWRLLPEVVKVQEKLQQLERERSEAADRVGTAKGAAEGGAAHAEEVDLDRRVGRASEDKYAAAKKQAEKAVDQYRQNRAEVKALNHDVEQQRKAYDLVRIDAMKKTCREMCQAQYSDGQAVAELAAKIIETKERMLDRMSSAQRQFLPNDEIRSRSGIPVAGGVARLEFAGVKPQATKDYQRKVNVFGAHLDREDG